MLPLRRLTLALMGVLALSALYLPLRASAEVTVRIEVRWPGQQPDAVEQGITNPIERALRRVSNVSRIQSLTHQGQCVIEVLLQDVSPEQALAQVGTALASVKHALPPGATAPTAHIPQQPLPRLDAPVAAPSNQAPRP